MSYVPNVVSVGVCAVFTESLKARFLEGFPKCLLGWFPFEPSCPVNLADFTFTDPILCLGYHFLLLCFLQGGSCELAFGIVTKRHGDFLKSQA